MLLKKKDLTPAQVYGSGLAAILICLLLHLVLGQTGLLYLAMGITVLTMVWTTPARYFAILWFALGELLGWLVSRIILTTIYAVIVLPVSLFVWKHIRKRMGLSSFKHGTGSVYKIRDHRFAARDFEKPF